MPVSEENISAIERELRKHLQDIRRREVKGQPVGIKDLTVTYGKLVCLTKVGIANGQGPFLDSLADRCRARNQPEFDCIVVTQRTGSPGKEWSGGREAWERQVWDCYETYAKHLDA